MSGATYLYRYVDGEDRDEGGHVFQRNLFLIRYPVISATRKGVWIETGYRKRRFVLLEGDRRFAYPDLENARRSYRRRKLMQEWHAERTALQAAFGRSLKDEDFPQETGRTHRVRPDDAVELAA